MANLCANFGHIYFFVPTKCFSCPPLPPPPNVDAGTATAD